MEKSTVYGILIFLVIIVAGFIFLKPSTAIAVNGVDPVVVQGEVRRVLISEKNLNYYPNEIKVKANQPVQISLDDSVKGCLRSFAIRELGVSQYAKSPRETIDFTPTKKGTFTFSCSMGMGYGKLIVE